MWWGMMQYLQYCVVTDWPDWVVLNAWLGMI
jgi:hypothetical protein